MSKSMSHAPTLSSLVELLHRRAAQAGSRRAYTFLQDGESGEVDITYQELELRARAIAASLQESRATNERVVLLYPPGLDFITAFWGCLYAGAVAVPVFPARLARHVPRLNAILADAQPTAILTTSKILAQVEGLFDGAPLH